ncbi:MAG: chromate transporter [Casimicrobium sp.]
MKDANVLVDMALLYVTLSFLCIGGTIPLIPDMHRFFVDSRGLMTTSEFAGYIALAQTAPGPNILYVALFGYHVAGVAGALTTLGAISLGPFVLVIITTKFFTRLQANPWREIVLRGLAPVTVGLMLAGCALLTKGFVDPRAWLVAAVALAAFFALPKLHPLWLIATGALVGVALGM